MACTSCLLSSFLQVHERYVKFWAKKVMVSPAQAVVPLKEIDYQLASKFEVRDPSQRYGSRCALKVRGISYP